MQTQTSVPSDAWEMTLGEIDYLAALPTAVCLWRVRMGYGPDDDGTYYYDKDAALDGLAAAAQVCEYSIMEDVGVERSLVLAVDSVRQTAQVKVPL